MSDQLIPTVALYTLLSRAGAGDHSAFAQFYDRVSAPLYTLALRLLDNQHEARDAFQDGMEHLWRMAPTFDSTRHSAFLWSAELFLSRLTHRAIFTAAAMPDAPNRRPQSKLFAARAAAVAR